MLSFRIIASPFWVCFFNPIYTQYEHKDLNVTTELERTPIPDDTPQYAPGSTSRPSRAGRGIPEAAWDIHAPYIDAIQRLKRERNAIILAHNYQNPEIYHGVSDLTGDSLALARDAADIDADVIVMCGVHFMAETAKLMNPEKTVLIPDPEAGCSLAASISAEDVRMLRKRYPGVPVVTYVNTSVEVKAESDVCCTSANAVEIVESLGSSRVIFLPDEYLGRYVASRSEVDVICWNGHCEVHERFSAPAIRAYREAYDDLLVLGHPECPPEVLAQADFVGSTAGMIQEIIGRNPRRALLATERSMTDNLAVEFPGVEFVRPGYQCPHMKRITLPKILEALRSMRHVVDIDPAVAGSARQAVVRMLHPVQQPVC